MLGLVMRTTGSWYKVLPIPVNNDFATVECRLRGNYRLRGNKQTNPVAVGDIVKVIVLDVDEKKHRIGLSMRQVKE